MTRDSQTTLVGHVTDVFGHRFVVRTATGKVLADLGPKGAEQITLHEGDQVELSGDMKPTELKVARLTKKGGACIVIEHKKPHEHGHEHEHEAADPAAALQTARANGFTVFGDPRRKPKHFEILGRDNGGDFVELHIELDGALRKTKAVEGDDHKWASEMSSPPKRPALRK